MLKDINNELIEIGDIIIVPKNSTLTKSYVLGYTKSGSIIVSCARENYKWIYKKNPANTGYWNRTIKDKKIEGEGIGEISYRGYHDLSLHNAKQSLKWHGDLLIVQKNCEIPNNLQKFIKH